MFGQLPFQCHAHGADQGGYDADAIPVWRRGRAPIIQRRAAADGGYPGQREWGAFNMNQESSTTTSVGVRPVLQQRLTGKR